jgi:hypothetical protein
MVTGPVHFVHLGGEWRWQHWRAVETGRRLQGWRAPETILWTVDAGADFGFYPHHVDVRPLEVPDWLRDHPIQLANVKDLYAWQLLYEHGGMYLDLDTISLRPAWDLLEDGASVCPSLEAPPEEFQAWEHPLNSAVVIGRRGADVLLDMATEALERLTAGESRWGETGPHLLTDFWKARPAEFSPAPFPKLNGWSYHSIGDYYRQPRDPGGDVRVIHLYSSDHLDDFHADRWMPTYA